VQLPVQVTVEYFGILLVGSIVVKVAELILVTLPFESFTNLVVTGPMVVEVVAEKAAPFKSKPIPQNAIQENNDLMFIKPSN